MGGNDQKHVGQELIDDDTDLFEMIIFTLSPILGGRSEVLATPFIETLKHLELQQKKVKSDRWNAFMDAVYADMSNGIDKHKRQKYMETIQPEKARKKLAMKTDMDQLKRLKEDQERAKQSEQGG